MDKTFDAQRRAWLTAVTASALTMTALGMAKTASAEAETAQPSLPELTAFESRTALKPLAFNPAKLDGLSERLIYSHWQNNYGGSVKALAVVKQHIVQALANKDTPPYIYNDLKREHLLRTGSVVLHEGYFNNLGGNGQAGASERKLISAAFGSFDTWETEFRRIGAGLGGGSGWVVLGFNTHTGQLENYCLADHAHGPAATLPLLIMDMYEHSYQMDYGAAATQYIDAFFKNIQWDMVASRIELAQKIRTA